MSNGLLASLPPPAPHGPVAEVEAAFRANRDVLLEYARRHIPPDLRRHLDPQDVTQDVCLELFRRASDVDWRDADYARRFLLTLARSRLVDLVRGHRAVKRGGGAGRLEEVRSAHPGPAARDAVVGLLEHLAVYERTPSQSAIAHEVAAFVQRSIDRLAPDHARCVRLRHIEQRSVAETAGLMNRTEPSVHLLCHRALNHLRKELVQIAVYA